MKSIVQEASSIEKAIFQAWQRAGQPDDFSIRIFEVPQKNFFGFTIKSAKIAIFFQEQPKKKEAKPVQQQPQQQAKPKVQARPLPEQKPKTMQPREKVQESREQGDAQQAAKPKNDTPLWTPSMVQYSQKWLDDLFVLAEQKKIPFVIEPQKYHLKVMFDKALFDDEERCKTFYRSCAHLLLQSLRNTCKRPLKGFKVVCMHNA
jgi:hypothetical protein